MTILPLQLKSSYWLGLGILVVAGLLSALTAHGQFSLPASISCPAGYTLRACTVAEACRVTCSGGGGLAPAVQPVPPAIRPTYPVQQPPQVCTHVYDPVCGSNGATYSNSCLARLSGAAVVYRGACVQQQPVQPRLYPTYLTPVTWPATPQWPYKSINSYQWHSVNAWTR